jgi:hypothetical protein
MVASMQAAEETEEKKVRIKTAEFKQTNIDRIIDINKRRVGGPVNSK